MTAQVDEKPSVKALLREVIEAQPEDASYEEILREIAFERMVARGMADVRAGHSVSHDEALRSINPTTNWNGRWTDSGNAMQ